MNAVAAVANRVPGCCHAVRCNKDGCGVSLKGVPRSRLLVDMDCNALNIPSQQKRCDYLFVGEEGNTTCVAPIELKSGGLTATGVLDQLEGGTGLADKWLPQGIRFQFVPVLAHEKSIHREERRKLRKRKLRLRGDQKIAVLIRCGDPLTKALGL